MLQRDALMLHRPELVRFCAHLTGDPDAAEDLAQQTLLEAWRSAEQLRDPARQRAWLQGIARHLCAGWRRRRRREGARMALGHELTGQSVPGRVGRIDDDLEAELEREELIALLDRALALLPPETREVLVHRYLREASLATIARRLGISEPAASMRLSRGKQLLRRVLITDFGEEAAAYGLADPAGDGWQESRIWCAYCGGARLLARLPPPPGTVAFRCPGCASDSRTPGAEFRLTNPHYRRLIGGLKRPATVLARTAAWIDAFYRPILTAGGQSCPCLACGRPARVRVRSGAEAVMPSSPHLITIDCPACGEALSLSLSGLVQSLPQVQRFWRRHGRMRMLPHRLGMAGGHPAIVSRVESVRGAAYLEMVHHRDSLTLLTVSGDAGSIC